MYFDAVLTKDCVPVFNGTPEETREWLIANHDPEAKHLDVCVGSTLKYMTISEYLAKRAVA